MKCWMLVILVDIAMVIYYEEISQFNVIPSYIPDALHLATYDKRLPHFLQILLQYS